MRGGRAEGVLPPPSVWCEGRGESSESERSRVQSEEGKGKEESSRKARGWSRTATSRPAVNYLLQTYLIHEQSPFPAHPAPRRDMLSQKNTFQPTPKPCTFKVAITPQLQRHHNHFNLHPTYSTPTLHFASRIRLLCRSL
jgi:hypothetical protein